MITEYKDAMREYKRPLSQEDEDNIRTVKGLGNHLYEFINNLEAADCREIALANTRLEEAVMWAVKAITKDRFPV